MLLNGNYIGILTYPGAKGICIKNDVNPNFGKKIAPLCMEKGKII